MPAYQSYFNWSKTQQLFFIIAPLVFGLTLGCVSELKRGNTIASQALLFKLTLHGQPQELEHFLRLHPQKINEVDENGVSALMIASFHDKADNLNLLLRYGASPTLFDRDGQTALHYASVHPTQSTCKILTRFPPLLEQMDKYGLTPLLYAARHGSKTCLESLLEAGSDIHKNGPDQWTALFYAVPRDQLDIIDLLLKYGANLNDVDLEGNSLLQHAQIYNAHKAYKRIEEALETNKATKSKNNQKQILKIVPTNHEQNKKLK